MTPLRWLAAFIAAPLIPILLLATLCAVGIGLNAFGPLLEVMLGVGYGTMILIGVPIYFLFGRKRRPSLRLAGFIGAGVAAAPWIIFYAASLVDVSRSAYPPDYVDAARPIFGWIATMALLGALGGVIGWLIAYWQPGTRERATT